MQGAFNSGRFPCPCCGHLVFDEPTGSYDICPVCFWEDDEFQLLCPTRGGANQVSLIEGQRNYQRFRVCEPRFAKNVRLARKDEPVETGWRPIDPAVDRIKDASKYPRDVTELYYWRRKQ